MWDLNPILQKYVMNCLIVICSQFLCLCVVQLRNNTTLMTDGVLVWQFMSVLYASKFFSVDSCWSVMIKKTDSYCAVPVDSMFTSIGFVGTCSLIFRIIFSLGSSSKRDMESAVVFILSGTCAMVKLNCGTKSKAFHKGVGNIFVWKNLVTDLLSVMMITGFVVPQNLCPNSLKTR